MRYLGDLTPRPPLLRYVGDLTPRPCDPKTPWTRWSVTLAWRIELVDDAKKDLSKLDKPIARRITAFLGRTGFAP